MKPTACSFKPASFLFIRHSSFASR